MTSHYTQGTVTTLNDFEGVLGRPLETSFGLSQFHGHGSWLVCEVALIVCTRCVSLLIVFFDCANVRASGGAIKLFYMDLPVLDEN
jgi:hypothetical protein